MKVKNMLESSRDAQKEKIIQFANIAYSKMISIGLKPKHITQLLSNYRFMMTKEPAYNVTMFLAEEGYVVAYKRAKS